MCSPAALILPRMLTPRSALRRLMALLIPVCMIWVFAACVSQCAGHEVLDAEGVEAHAVSTQGFVEAEDCCPDGEASCGVTAHRAMFVSHMNVAEPAPEVAVLPAADGAFACQAYSMPPDRTADPPFERLRTLRI